MPFDADYVRTMRAKRPTILPIPEIISRPYTFDLRAGFPDVKPKVVPCGMYLLCQLRTPRKGRQIPNPLRGQPDQPDFKTLWFPDQVVDDEKFQVQTALVRAMGPVAFKFRDRALDDPRGVGWPEGEWVFPGDFIRVPKYGGDRHEVVFREEGADSDTSALFVMIKDGDVLGVVPEDVDPLSIKTLL